MTAPARAEDGPTPEAQRWANLTRTELDAAAINEIAPGLLPEVKRLADALTEAGRQLDAVAAYADLETERANKAEGERDRLRAVVDAVDRLAGVWSAMPDATCCDQCQSRRVALRDCGDDLRAVLAAPDTNGDGQGGGE